MNPNYFVIFGASLLFLLASAWSYAGVKTRVRHVRRSDRSHTVKDAETMYKVACTAYALYPTDPNSAETCYFAARAYACALADETDLSGDAEEFINKGKKSSQLAEKRLNARGTAISEKESANMALYAKRKDLSECVPEEVLKLIQDIEEKHFRPKG